MSGIAGILRTDGAPVDHRLLGWFTDSLRLRGPDALNTWSEGSVGFSHALLRSTVEAAGERQPLSLDGRVWIVADGRVDARSDLVRALNSRSVVPRACPDVELILRAYLRWGPKCVDHLLGDFAFAIWDSVEQRLFCARDHMGVKPFYFAHVGRSLLFSSTIDTLRLHPEVSNDLNDAAIADFLRVGFNRERSTTSFKDIQRLPPAHTLTWAGDAVAIERYWTLPIEEPLYRRKARDYVDGFLSVVREAVEDRLRVPRVGVFMSGGLDSPMLAATAKQVLDGGSAEIPVRAFTFVYDSLFADPERAHAGLVADHLRIPIHYYARDERIGWFPEHGQTLPEPAEALMDRSPELRCYQEAAEHSPVAFYGEGPDNALSYEWHAHLSQLVRTRRFMRLSADVTKHVLRHRRVPPLSTVSRLLTTRRSWPPNLVSAPVSQIGAGSLSRHPWRPRGYASMLLPDWQHLFERMEPAYTRAPLEVRHPYVDIRVLRYMLRVPAMPWCRSKHLLRVALRGTLPERARMRPKAALAGDPLREQIRRCGFPAARPGPRSGNYDNGAADDALHFVALSYWLDQYANRPHCKREEREENGLKTAAST